MKSQNPNKLLPLNWHKTAETMLKTHRFIMLVGERGVGKTAWAIKIGQQKTNQPVEIIQGTPEMELPHVWGTYLLIHGETKFCDGPLPRALKNNRYLLVEEINLVPMELRATFLALRGQNQILNPLTGEAIPIPSTFRLIATSNYENVRCSHKSLMGIGQTLIDDFLILEVPKLNKKTIWKLLRFHFPNANKNEILKVTELWEKYHSVHENEDHSVYLGFRSAMHLFQLLQQGMEEQTAVEIALINKYILHKETHEAAKFLNSL